MSAPGVELLDELRRGTRALLDPSIRDGWVRETLRRAPLPEAACALDLLCQQVEQADGEAREVLISVVRVLLSASHEGMAQELRDEAHAQSLLALGRFLRWPTHTAARTDPAERTVPLTSGRTLTLGERKTLARRPDRAAFDRLLGDPHPAVIQLLLGNPRLTEDDVVRLASRRPCFPDILSELARSARWSVRPRVRRALVLNPSTPAEIAVPMVLLLVRPELELVLEITEANAPVRAAALELLRRRPPQLDDREEGLPQ